MNIAILALVAAFAIFAVPAVHNSVDKALGGGPVQRVVEQVQPVVQAAQQADPSNPLTNLVAVALLALSHYKAIQTQPPQQPTAKNSQAP